MSKVLPLPQRKSPRLHNYDYAQAGAYFVTICTFGREWLFGDVVDGEMQLAALGAIADRVWYTLPDHHPQLELDAFIVMPNHVHGIVVIHDQVDMLGRAQTDEARLVPTDTPSPSVGPAHASSAASYPASNPPSPRLPGANPPSRRAKGPPPRSLGAIIGAYKSAVTRDINTFMGLRAPIVWQSRYHDHIIRNMHELARIRDYVAHNPARWDADTFFTARSPGSP